MAVTVLISSPLPGAVGISKVDRYTKCLRDESMLRKLRAIVKGYGVGNVATELGNNGFGL
ncbi:MAG TPA: hypothetical protein VMR18_00140 [Candidatus Saccharimonadales bacterium]|nr:hypothetical protein [Candidatus Saccharimonadales bacterium]